MSYSSSEYGRNVVHVSAPFQCEMTVLEAVFDARWVHKLP